MTNQIKEIEHIKEMIASVKPDDTATLDEIDARVWCVEYKIAYVSNKREYIESCDCGDYEILIINNRDFSEIYEPDTNG